MNRITTEVFRQQLEDRAAQNVEPDSDWMTDVLNRRQPALTEQSVADYRQIVLDASEADAELVFYIELNPSGPKPCSIWSRQIDQLNDNYVYVGNSVGVPLLRPIQSSGLTPV